ncbi:hypothetical protein [Nocardioides humi]|uniref:hypothetical protein n=1 Tax=Nocardioides humi TaxID=449461 RepID=UPI0011278E0F|nr:hypothetical protein [Nocardioides humi]
MPPSGRFWRSSLDGAASRSALPDGLILLDLPDHDSIRTAHHQEAERIVALADALIWVVDPQKYADAAIHQRFLRPLAGHRDVTMVVLNHLDTVPEEMRADLLRDLRKVLVADGMRDPRILGSAPGTGSGSASCAPRSAGGSRRAGTPSAAPRPTSPRRRPGWPRRPATPRPRFRTSGSRTSSDVSRRRPAAMPGGRWTAPPSMPRSGP